MLNANGSRHRGSRSLVAVATLGLAVLGVGCNLEMRDDSRVKPYEKSPVFADGRSSRTLVPGTVAHRPGALDPNSALLTGFNADGQPTADLPLPVTAELLAEGKKQFELEWSRIVAAFANHPSIVMWVSMRVTRRGSAAMCFTTRAVAARKGMPLPWAWIPIVVSMQVARETHKRSVGLKADPFPWLSTGASVIISVPLLTCTAVVRRSPW
mgnify:CR=1 FL=1